MSDDWYRDNADDRCPCCGGRSWGQTPDGVIECTRCWWTDQPERTAAAMIARVPRSGADERAPSSKD